MRSLDRWKLGLDLHGGEPRGEGPLKAELHKLGSMTRICLFWIGVAALAFAQGRPVTLADIAAGNAWWAHIQTLADDGMEGRLTGSEGYLRAARYVVSQFDAAGLQPAGVDGWYQAVRFDVTRVLADKSSMALVNGRTEPLQLGRDAV